jgi:hypothetical protein
MLGTDEALARIRVSIELRDSHAAERLLHQFSETDDGAWLLRICLAVALQRRGHDLATGRNDP